MSRGHDEFREVGKAVSPFRVPEGAEYVKALGPQGTLVAIGKIIIPGLYHPMVVMP